MNKIKAVTPNNNKYVLDANELLTSKTDTQGRIIYSSPNFIKASKYQEEELFNQPHNIIRHPDMPKTIFALLWENIKQHNEFFGYIKNLCKDGSFYWVYANITSSFSPDETHLGYYSVRRAPDKEKLSRIKTLYSEMLRVEQQAPNDELAIQAGRQVLNQELNNKKQEYHEFIIKF